MTVKQGMCELSSRAKAFSVEALIGTKKRTRSESPQPPEQYGSNGLARLSGTGTPNKPLEHPINVELCSRELWRKFHALGTEMIITKSGRRMFPTVKIRLSGLDPSVSYIVFMDIVPVDDKRYRYVYHSSQWMVAGSGDPPLSPNLYIHPDSPATGQLWMAQGVVAFDKLKLTNNRKPLVRGQVSLHSMHKYQPRVHILPTNDLETPPEQQAIIEEALTFTFPETTFTTVTAYQNQQITRLKIASNPFAKGFREASRTRDSMEDNMGQDSTFLSGYTSSAFNTRSLLNLSTDVKLFPSDQILPGLSSYPSSSSPICLHNNNTAYAFHPVTLPVRFVVPPKDMNSHSDQQLNFTSNDVTEQTEAGYMTQCLNLYQQSNHFWDVSRYPNFNLGRQVESTPYSISHEKDSRFIASNDVSQCTTINCTKFLSVKNNLCNNSQNRSVPTLCIPAKNIHSGDKNVQQNVTRNVDMNSSSPVLHRSEVNKLKVSIPLDLSKIKP